MSTPPANIVGATTTSDLSRLTTSSQRAATAGFTPHDTYSFHEQFSTATEGSVQLVESHTSGKLFIVKHLFERSKATTHQDDNDTSVPNEARILLTHLSPGHPSIIALLACEANPGDGGGYRLILPYCNGGDLFDQLAYSRRRNRVLAEQFVLHVIVSLVDALAYTHHGLRYLVEGEGRKYTLDAGHEAVIHGDIKEENIFLDWPVERVGGMPNVVLGDWGAAQVAGKKVLAGCGIGTLAYHAPEDRDVYGDAEVSDPKNRALFEEMVERRTTKGDIYALGLVMARLVATEEDLWPMGRDPAELRVREEYTTPELGDLVRSCLSVDPGLRGEASCKEGIGFLPVIQKLREARDRLIESRPEPRRLEWNKPWPR